MVHSKLQYLREPGLDATPTLVLRRSWTAFLVCPDNQLQAVCNSQGALGSRDAG